MGGKWHSSRALRTLKIFQSHIFGKQIKFLYEIKLPTFIRNLYYIKINFKMARKDWNKTNGEAVSPSTER